MNVDVMDARRRLPLGILAVSAAVIPVSGPQNNRKLGGHPEPPSDLRRRPSSCAAVAAVSIARSSRLDGEAVEFGFFRIGGPLACPLRRSTGSPADFPRRASPCMAVMSGLLLHPLTSDQLSKDYGLKAVTISVSSLFIMGMAGHRSARRGRSRSRLHDLLADHDPGSSYFLIRTGSSIGQRDERPEREQVYLGSHGSLPGSLIVTGGALLCRRLHPRRFAGRR